MTVNTIWLTTNRTCNNKCEWCYAKNGKPTEQMSLADACGIVDVAKKMHVKKIIIIGGEPTLYDNLFELVKYISDNGIEVWMASNGRMMSDADFAKKLVSCGVSRFDLSLKATSEGEYFELTHNKGFDEALKGYKNLADLGLFPNMSYVIIDDNFKKIEEIIEIIEKNNIRNFTFQFVKPVVSLKSDDIMPLDKMGSFVAQIYKRMKNVDVNYKLEISFPLCVIEPQILSEMIEAKVINTCCHIQKGTGVVFDNYFRILPCNHFVDFPYKPESMKGCTQASLEEYFESPEVLEFRKKSRYYPSEKCASCSLWNICGGGCFTRWFYIDPKTAINGFSKNAQESFSKYVP